MSPREERARHVQRNRMQQDSGKEIQYEQSGGGGLSPPQDDVYRPAKAPTYFAAPSLPRIRDLKPSRL